MLKKVVTWGLAAFLAYYLVADPSGFASTFHRALSSFSSAGVTLAKFVRSA